MGWISKNGYKVLLVEKKVIVRSDQLLCKVLIYLKYCCADVSILWGNPESVVDCCLGSATMISDFVEYLQTDWSLKSSGVTGYMNPLRHLLDFPRSYSDLTQIKSSVFIPFEIYIQRVKCYLSKKNEIRLERSLECWLSE